MGRDVVLVSSADETAFEVRDILTRCAIGRGGGAGTLRFYSSGDVEWFRAVGGRLFGEELGTVGRLTWPTPPPVADDQPPPTPLDRGAASG
jgi:glutamate racemase